MTNWMTNPIMTWAGNKVTDHGRQPLSTKVTQISTDKRMVDGTLRRQFIAIKRTWDVTWQDLPSTNTVTTGFKTADGQWSGEQIEAFYRTTPGKFRMILRRGSATGIADPAPAESALPFQDQNFYVVNVMFTDFSKTVKKRGNVDLWDIELTLEEV